MKQQHSKKESRSTVCEGAVRESGRSASRLDQPVYSGGTQLLLDGEATALSRKAVELALAGDPTALRLCLDRTVAPRRDRPVELSLPPINSAADILGAIKAVADAVGRGGITPGEGFALSQMIESFLRAIDASDFDNRLRQLEDAQSASRPDPYRYMPR